MTSPGLRLNGEERLCGAGSAAEFRVAARAAIDPSARTQRTTAPTRESE